MRFFLTAVAITGLLCTGLVSTPASAETIIPGEQAAEAIDRALEQAALTGMTYREEGELRQVNAAGNVAVSFEGRKVDTIVLREDGKAVVLAPHKQDPGNLQISEQLRRAFGYAKNAYATLPDEDGATDPFLEWFDPFTAYARMQTAQVVVDDAGRAIEVRFGRERALQVVNWTAPQAIRPAADQILDQETWATVVYAETSAHFLHVYLEELGELAQSYPYFSSDPVGTLRKAARDTGWPAKPSAGGITITMTDSVGTTWRAVFAARPGGVTITKFVVTKKPDVVTMEVASAKALMGQFAISTLDLVTCPLTCRLQGGSTPLTAANAEKSLLRALRDLGITRQTSGPDYPELDDGMLASFGLTVSGNTFTGGLSFSLAGMCLLVPIKGPGIWQWPSSMAARPGQVGPLGTCTT